MLVHPFPPVYDAKSEILILGSFPSVKSRENMFYYGHPQNRFWRVLAAVYKSDVPQSIDEKVRFLLEHHIALWDVLASCEITGSADSSIISDGIAGHINAHIRRGMIDILTQDAAKDCFDYRESLDITIIIDCCHTVLLQMIRINHIDVA